MPSMPGRSAKRVRVDTTATPSDWPFIFPSTMVLGKLIPASTPSGDPQPDTLMRLLVVRLGIDANRLPYNNIERVPVSSINFTFTESLTVAGITMRFLNISKRIVVLDFPARKSYPPAPIAEKDD